MNDYKRAGQNRIFAIISVNHDVEINIIMIPHPHISIGESEEAVPVIFLRF